MTESKFTPPSKQSLIQAIVWSLMGAVTILILIVLPAEYGIDVSGFGSFSGLSKLSSSPDISAAKRSVAVPIARQTEVVMFTPEENLVGDPPAIADETISHGHDTPYSSKTIEIPLRPEQELEYKMILESGEPMLYTWSVDKGTVYTDFHGHPPDGPEGFWMRYKESETGEEHGMLIAPFSGEHGWYWLNYNEFPITITLKFEGNFASADFVPGFE